MKNIALFFLSIALLGRILIGLETQKERKVSLSKQLIRTFNVGYEKGRKAGIKEGLTTCDDVIDQIPSGRY